MKIPLFLYLAAQMKKLLGTLVEKHCSRPVFSTFFGSRHPVRLKKKLAAPFPG